MGRNDTELGETGRLRDREVVTYFIESQTFSKRLTPEKMFFVLKKMIYFLTVFFL